MLIRRAPVPEEILVEIVDNVFLPLLRAASMKAFLRRADEGTLSRLLAEASIVLATSRGNATAILKDVATAYKGGHRSHRRQGQAGVRCQSRG